MAMIYQDPTQEEANLPSTQSAAAKRQAHSLSIVRDLESGPGCVIEKGETYLPKAPGESDANYRVRQRRATFFNIFAHTVKGLVGFVFRKDPVLGDDVPVTIRGDEEGLGGHWENIDLAGTHGDVFLRDLMQDAMVAGHSAILVEFPATEGAQERSDELRGEIRPYWVPVKKDDILSWRTTIEGGKTILTQIVIRECTMAPFGEFGEKLQTRYRVLCRAPFGAAGPRVGWRLLEINDRKVTQIAKGLYSNQSEIPIAEVVTSGRKSMFESEPPLLPLAYLNLAHYRQWSDYDSSIWKTCTPIFVESGVQVETDVNGQKRVLGPSNGLAYPNPDAKAYYVTHEGGALEKVKQSLDDLMSAMASMGMGMMSNEKRVAETEKSKEMSKAGQDSQLAVSARGLQDGVERALQFHANYLKEKDGGSIQINRDYNEMLAGADVMTAYANLVAAGFPKEIAVRMLQIGGRVPESEDPEALAMEWDATQAAVDEQKRLDQQAQIDKVQQDRAA